jgi:enterochelin esterase-like enzyme
MLRWLFVALLFVPFAACATEPYSPPPGSRFETIETFPSRFVTPRRVTVWLPAGYDARTTRYRVLYMHDGQNLFEPTTSYGGEPWGVDRAAARLIAEKRIAPTIIVGIWNSPSRWQDYAPQRAIEAIPADRLKPNATGPAPPLHAENDLRFLVEELKPLIDRRYRTVRGPEGTAIMGSSMGGLISAYALARYPDVFGGAGCISIHAPVVMPGENPPAIVELMSAAFRDWLAANLPRPGAHRLYMDRGDQTLDAVYPPFQDKLDAALHAAGWREPHFVSQVFPGGAHNEVSWRARLDVPLTYLLAP